MNEKVAKSTKPENRAAANNPKQKKSSNGGTAQFMDLREGNSIKTQQNIINEKDTLQQKNTHQQKTNKTGLPDKIKNTIENKSGYSLDDVKVHYNSDKPAQLHALAYTQATNIYIASGQEKHLPHEAGHVVQQKQGRVKPTYYHNSIPINDNATLEHEADTIPIQKNKYTNTSLQNSSTSAPIQMMKKFDDEKILGILRTINEFNHLDENSINLDYASRVNTLLSEIYLVDFQFLAVTSISYDEDDQNLLPDKKIHQFDKKIKEKKLTIEKNELIISKLLKNLEINKSSLTKRELNIICNNIDFLRNQTLKLKKEIIELNNEINELNKEKVRFTLLYQEKMTYLTEVKEKVQKRISNLERMITIYNNRITQEKDTLNHKELDSLFKSFLSLEKRLNASKSFEKNLTEQITLLQSALQKAEHGQGYAYNMNVLLTQFDEDIQYYMAIVAPPTEMQHKDFIPDNEHIKALGTQVQIGANTPIRALSWYLKYLLQPQPAIGTTPIIRNFSTSKKDFIDLLSKVRSEKGGEHGDDYDSMLNEDYKVPNQFGIKAEWFNEHINEKTHNLRSITESTDETSAVPESLLKNGGIRKKINDLKEMIGWGIVEENQIFKATDIHFFDEKHAALFSIPEAGKTPKLYSAQEARNFYTETSLFMHDIELKFSQNLPEFINKESNLDANTFKKKLYTLLKVNHCLPVTDTDRHGNKIESLNQQTEFANEHFQNITEENITLLKNKVLSLIEPQKNKISGYKESLKEVGGNFKIQYKEIIRNEEYKKVATDIYETLRKGIDSPDLRIVKLKELKNNLISLNIINKLKEIDENALRDELIRKFKDASEAAKSKKIDIIENIIEFESDFYSNSGLHQELLFLGIENPRSEIVKLFSEGSINLTIGEVHPISDKIHITAFYLKLLRSLFHFDKKQKQTINEKLSDSQGDPKILGDSKALDSEMFSSRTSDDSIYTILNRNSHETRQIGDENVQIPFDKQTSKGRFKPNDRSRIKPYAPFIGGISGTTKDISGLLLHNKQFNNEKEYWNFQLLNAAFMITYSYHSFMEVVISAARTYIKFHPSECSLSKTILGFLCRLKDDKYEELETKEIIKRLKNAIDGRKMLFPPKKKQ